MTKPDSLPANVAALPFEQALEELEGIVRRLERGDVPLEDSIAIYERGEALKTHCEALLKRAEARIEKITIGPDGRAAGATPLDVEPELRAYGAGHAAARQARYAASGLPISDTPGLLITKCVERHAFGNYRAALPEGVESEAKQWEERMYDKSAVDKNKWMIDPE